MSSAATTEKPEGVRHAMPHPEDYFAKVRDSNPFTGNRVNDPSGSFVDVPAVHGESFDHLVKRAGQVFRERSGVGAVLLGGAGVGKSHLLARLYRWAGEGAGDGGPRAYYVYLHNILSDPDRLPRYLLKYVVSRLSEGGGGPLHQTPLYRLVDRAIRHSAEVAGVETGNTKVEKDAFRACFGETVGGRDVSEVLFQFRRHARPEKVDEPGRRQSASEAIAWLSGDAIDAEAARRLRLMVDNEGKAVLGDDKDVEQVLLALARLALVCEKPFILCIDQVDNIDPDKLKSLARFLHALLDHATNLLVITSGVQNTMLEFKKEGVIPEAAWDRIAQHQVPLRRVSKEDARMILEARLEQFHEPFMEVEPVRRWLREDTLFPLGRGWLAGRFGDAIEAEVRPRDVLTWGREGWEDEQAKLARLGGEEWLGSWSSAASGPPPVTPPPRPLTPKELEEAIDEAVDRKVEEQIALHRLQPGSLPPDAGNLSGLVETLLGHCVGAGVPYGVRGVERLTKKGNRMPPYDLLVRDRPGPDGREVTTGVLFVTNGGNSATAALKRLLEDARAPDHRILVTDDERSRLELGAQGDIYYRALVKLGPGKFDHIKLRFDQYAGLDALSGVVGMAKSGDLEVEAPRGTPRRVLEAEVIASHHRKDRYRALPLLCTLLTKDPPPEKPLEESAAPGLDEKDVRQYVRAQLAWQMGSTAQAIARGYVGAMPAPKVSPEAAWPQVKAIAERMHAEGLVHATPQDNDLFLLLRK